MQIGNVIIDGPAEEIKVIPYDGKDVVFKARVVLNKDYEDFDKLCPRPEAPEIIKKGGERIKDVNDKEFNKALDIWAVRRVDYMILKSLEPSEIKWETVDMSKPETWEGFRQELENIFGEVVTRTIVGLAYSACGLNQTKIEEATKRFLAGREEVQEK